MKSIETGMSVRELVLAHPRAVPILERAGIDYCCGGAQSLAEACASKGVERGELERRLAEAEAEEAPRAEFTDWDHATLHQLADHIVHRHHEFTRRAGQEIKRLLPPAEAAHGEAHPELLRIGAIFQRFNQDMLFHMVKEEKIVFPYVAALESRARGEGPVGAAPAYPGGSPIAVMLEDHDAAGAHMAEMRRLSGGFTPPPDACATLHRLYGELAELEKDLHWHVHLENNILFPRAQELEARLHPGAAAEVPEAPAAAKH